MNNLSSRERLKKKIKDKKTQRLNGSGVGNLNDNTDIFSMINQVQNILKTNPELVNKVSSCVNSLMSNPELMQQLSSQINNNNYSSQTLQSNSSGESSQAVSKES